MILVGVAGTRGDTHHSDTRGGWTAHGGHGGVTPVGGQMGLGGAQPGNPRGGGRPVAGHSRVTPVGATETRGGEGVGG